jgi:hypothetical protein
MSLALITRFGRHSMQEKPLVFKPFGYLDPMPFEKNPSTGIHDPKHIIHSLR